MGLHIKPVCGFSKVDVGRCGVGISLDSQTWEKVEDPAEQLLHEIFGKGTRIYLSPDEARQVAAELLNQASLWETDHGQVEHTRLEKQMD